MKRSIYLLGFVILISILISSCTIENPTYVDDNEEIRVEFVTLYPNNWIPVNNSNFRWFQKISLYPLKFSYDYVGIVCYYLNEHNSWEALPSTRLFWLDDGTVYTDELWYSNDDDYLYIDYRNTIPVNPTYPKDAMKIKIVYYYSNN